MSGISATAKILRALGGANQKVNFVYEIEVSIAASGGFKAETHVINVTDAKAKRLGFINLTEGGRNLTLPVRWFRATNDIDCI